MGERGSGGGVEEDGEPCATWMAARNGTGGETEGGRERCPCLVLLEFVAPPNTTPGLGTIICTEHTVDRCPPYPTIYVDRGLPSEAVCCRGCSGACCE